MTELVVMRILGLFSAAAAVIPLVKLGLRVWQLSRPRSIVFVDRDGLVVKEITADSVFRIDPDELASLHERIRQKHDLTIGTRTAA